MVDTTPPNTQFHEYQPPTAVPAVEREEDAWSRAARKLGLGGTASIRQNVAKVQQTLRNNPGKALGGMALAVIAAGLLARKR